MPAPATLALLGDAPVYSAGPPMERVTPTGAAILRMLDVQYAPLPAMRVSASGYGAGGRDTPGQPNLLRLLVGEETLCRKPRSSRIAVIETVDRRFQSATHRLRQRTAARSRRMGRLPRYRADEEGPDRRAAHSALQPRPRARAPRSPFSRNHHHWPALAHRKQGLAGARIRRSADCMGSGAHQDRALALRRSRKRRAGVRRLPTHWPLQHSVPLEAGDAGRHARCSRRGTQRRRMR